MAKMTGRQNKKVANFLTTTFLKMLNDVYIRNDLDDAKALSDTRLLMPLIFTRNYLFENNLIEDIQKNPQNTENHRSFL
ncbi:MAG: hypothetical protein JXQ65_08990 [Candidatus Marinimicrobia bacterium]|nr:hypothetical protein [Candidatus Neomarinimicrobiota bacterium]